MMSLTRKSNYIHNQISSTDSKDSLPSPGRRVRFNLLELANQRVEQDYAEAQDTSLSTAEAMQRLSQPSAARASTSQISTSEATTDDSGSEETELSEGSGSEYTLDEDSPDDSTPAARPTQLTPSPAPGPSNGPDNKKGVSALWRRTRTKALSIGTILQERNVTHMVSRLEPMLKLSRIGEDERPLTMDPLSIDLMDFTKEVTMEASSQLVPSKPSFSSSEWSTMLSSLESKIEISEEPESNSSNVDQSTSQLWKLAIKRAVRKQESLSFQPRKQLGRHMRARPRRVAQGHDREYVERLSSAQNQQLSFVWEQAVQSAAAGAGSTAPPTPSPPPSTSVATSSSTTPSKGQTERRSIPDPSYYSKVSDV